jgi:hypothetical protein
MATNLMKHLLAVTRQIYKDQLYEWMLLVTRAIDGGGGGGGGLGPYDTVEKASSKRMLDATVAQLQPLKNGTEVWVESYKSDWYWDVQFPAATPTDNKTSCRPTAWIATGNPGAFVRSTEGDRGAWDQLVWHVALSGDDENDGLTPATSLADDAEIVRRWGPGSIPITKPVVINYANTPVGSTNYDVQWQGGSIKIVGVGVQQVSGVLSSVDEQDRDTGALWAIGGPAFAAPHVGLIVQITHSATPGNVGAYATILEIDEGLIVTVSPFGKTGVDPDVPFEEIVPEVGDTVQVITVPQLKIGTIRHQPGNFDEFTLAPLANCMIFDLVTLDGAADDSNVVGQIHASAPTFYHRCRYVDIRLAGTGDETHRVCGGIAVGPISIHPGASARFFSTGFLGEEDGGLEMLPGSDVWLDQDCYMIDATLDVLGPCHIRSSGTAYANGGGAGLELASGALYEQRGDVPDWGTNNDEHGVALLAGAHYIYDEKPIVNAGLGPGNEVSVGGTDKLYAEIPYTEGANGASIVRSV